MLGNDIDSCLRTHTGIYFHMFFILLIIQQTVPWHRCAAVEYEGLGTSNGWRRPQSSIPLRSNRRLTMAEERAVWCLQPRDTSGWCTGRELVNTMASHRVGHDWSHLAAAAAAVSEDKTTRFCRIVGFLLYHTHNEALCNQGKISLESTLRKLLRYKHRHYKFLFYIKQCHRE